MRRRKVHFQPERWHARPRVADLEAARLEVVGRLRSEELREDLLLHATTRRPAAAIEEDVHLPAMPMQVQVPRLPFLRQALCSPRRWAKQKKKSRTP